MVLGELVPKVPVFKHWQCRVKTNAPFTHSPDSKEDRMNGEEVDACHPVR